MKTMLHPTYFPNIAHMVAMLQAKSLCFEVCDNYTKQTYRNRACIYGANGRLQLNIPIKHSQKQRQLYKDVKIANDTNWQSQHLKSLQSAYRMSPFYEFYEDELISLFEMNTEFLMDFNFKCLEVLLECLQIKLNYTMTKAYEGNPKDLDDYRTLVNCKKELPQKLAHYTQVFTSKHGFISNLSILDLLFNEGPNTTTYIEQQVVSNTI